MNRFLDISSKKNSHASEEAEVSRVILKFMVYEQGFLESCQRELVGGHKFAFVNRIS